MAAVPNAAPGGVEGNRASFRFPKPAPRPKRPRKPLKRSWMRKKPPRRIARETPAERYYKKWVHWQECVGKCYGPVQQSHERDHTGMSLKENNFRSLAMCEWLHGCWTRADGPFSYWKPETRKRWFRLGVLEYHRRFFREHGCRPEDWTPSRSRGM